MKLLGTLGLACLVSGVAFAQQPGGPGDAGPGPGAGGGDKTKGAQGDVIDAEFEEKN